MKALFPVFLCCLRQYKTTCEVARVMSSHTFIAVAQQAHPTDVTATVSRKINQGHNNVCLLTATSLHRCPTSSNGQMGNTAQNCSSFGQISLLDLLVILCTGVCACMYVCAYVCMCLSHRTTLYS